MSKTDSQLLYVHRKPVYQKRLASTDNHRSMPHFHSPLAKRTVLVPRRRHSTPQPATVRFIEVKSPQSNAIVKHYYVQTKPSRVIKESELARSPPSRPATLVKPRNPDDRTVRLATTPTSIASSTDIFLPMAKKNRKIVVETPSPIGSDFQSYNHNTLARKQYKRRDRGYSFDPGCDIFGSDGGSSHDEPPRSKCCQWCHDKCFCRLPYCNLYECYHSCPFGCWIICFLLVVGLLIGIVISVTVLSS